MIGRSHLVGYVKVPTHPDGRFAGAVLYPISIAEVLVLRASNDDIRCLFNDELEKYILRRLAMVQIYLKYLNHYRSVDSPLTSYSCLDRRISCALPYRIENSVSSGRVCFYSSSLCAPTLSFCST